MAHDHHEQTPTAVTVRLPVSNLYCACCADELERALKANPHVIDANVDFQGDKVEVRYHAGMLDEQAIRELINGSNPLHLRSRADAGDDASAPPGPDGADHDGHEAGPDAI
jgi:cation transport ATPase